MLLLQVLQVAFFYTTMYDDAHPSFQNVVNNTVFTDFKGSSKSDGGPGDLPRRYWNHRKDWWMSGCFGNVLGLRGEDTVFHNLIYKSQAQNRCVLQFCVDSCADTSPQQKSGFFLENSSWTVRPARKNLKSLKGNDAFLTAFWDRL